MKQSLLDLLAGLSRNLPLALAVLAVVVVLIVVALVLLARKRRVEPPAEGDADAPPAPAAARPGEAVVVDFRQGGARLRLAAAFRRAMVQTRRYLGGRRQRYRIPWYLMMGQEAAGKSRVLAGSGLNLPLGAPPEPVPEEGEECVFWFFDRGIVLDLSGDYVLRSEDGASDERGWRHFLGLLRERRPERPLDGVILTIPCADLMGPADQARQRIAAATEKGAVFYGKLRQAQETLGMFFPVYVLLTGCERIPGFTGYVAEIPDHLRGDLFGWSNPYSLESAYRTEWVDEAFSALASGLHRVQVEAFGDQPVIEDPDGVFCFPEEVQQLREPLRAYLGQVFRPSAYHEILPCRGIYLCGDLAAATAAAEPPGLLSTAPAAGATVFVRDFLDRKVFPERALARPGLLALLEGDRRLKVVRTLVAVLAVLATVGTALGYRTLQARKTDLLEFLQPTAKNLDETRAKAMAGAQDHASMEAKAFTLFDDMAKLDADWFGSVFIPSSWFNSLNGELKDAMVNAYQEIILETLRWGLGMEMDRILAMASSGDRLAEGERVPFAEGMALAAASVVEEGAAPYGFQGEAEERRVQVRPFESTPEFIRLRQYVAALRTLESNAALFNNLQRTASLKDLNSLVLYLFRRQLPAGFFQHSRLYGTALTAVEYERFEPRDHRLAATAGARTLADRLFDRLFGDNPALLELEGVRRLLDEITGATGATGSAATRGLLGQLGGLHDRLVWSADALAAPELAWLSRENLALGSPYEQVLQQMAGSLALGRETADLVRGDGTSRFQLLRTRLFEIETSSTGPLVQRDAKSGSLGLSSRARWLKDALDGLLNQGFVGLGAAESPLNRLVPGGRVTWDTTALRDAVALYKPYEEFNQKLLAQFPPDLRNKLQTSARNQLGNRMLETVVAARLPGGDIDTSSAMLLEQEIASGVNNFQEAAVPLTELGGLFDRLGLPEPKARLSTVLAAQGWQLLTDVDRLLALRSPYTPKSRDFDWWDGGRKAALEAFQASDEAELAAYLSSQRDTVTDLASLYAAPVIQVLGGKGRLAWRSLEAPLARWTAISEQLSKYQGKEPGNSVASLEDFVARDLMELEPANCARRITVRMLSDSAPDFFLERRAVLRRQVYERCQELAGSHAAEGYRKLATFFNQRLAGRFPFSEEVPGRLDTEADPEDVRAFYHLFDAYAPIVRAVPDQGRPPGTGEFVERMTRVRALFDTFLDDPLRPQGPAYNLDVSFRDNRAGESGGDKIIRWSLASGDRAATYPGPRQPIPWTYATPVRLELQWAKDSPIVPVESAELPGVRVAGRTATIQYASRWALLALLRERGSREDAPGRDVQMLLLVVKTRPETEPLAEPKDARVFIRLTLRSPEVKEGGAAQAAVAGAGGVEAEAPGAQAKPPTPARDLEVPVFPVRAPRWPMQGDDAT